MSREYQQALDNHHSRIARDFAANDDGKSRQVECFVEDAIYVYLFEDGRHVQTQKIAIPESWEDSFPSDATVRRYIHRYAEIGSARITTLHG